MDKTPVNPPSKKVITENSFTFSVIGRIESCARYHYEAPRQPVYARAGAFLRWEQAIYADCAVDLAGFDRICLIWVFDQNKHRNWRSKVRVPVPAERDHYSVFATRSPYRPNPIGLSVVELKEVAPDGLLLGPCDLLNGTAILDVKPYIPEIDAFPDSRAGWRDRIEKAQYQVEFSAAAIQQMEFIFQHSALDLQNFCQIQLQHRPDDKSRKRLEVDSCSAQAGSWILHCRTWKIFFQIDEEAKHICVSYVEGNYSANELLPGAEDPYSDKELHRLFLQQNWTDK